MVPNVSIVGGKIIPYDLIAQFVMTYYVSIV